MVTCLLTDGCGPVLAHQMSNSRLLPKAPLLKCTTLLGFQPLSSQGVRVRVCVCVHALQLDSQTARQSPLALAEPRTAAYLGTNDCAAVLGHPVAQLELPLALAGELHNLQLLRAPGK